jgi:hypothetical protein
MYDTEVPPDVSITHPCPLEISVFFISEVGHRTLEFGDDGAGRHITGREDAQFRLSRPVRITGCVCYFDGTRGMIKLEVTGSMAGWM